MLAGEVELCARATAVGHGPSSPGAGEDRLTEGHGFLLDWERIPWNDPVPRASTAAHDRVIASLNRPQAGPRGERVPARFGAVAHVRLDHADRSSRPFGRSLVVVAGRPGAGDLYGHARRRRLVRPSIRFMGFAARTQARKRRVNLVRQLLCRRDAVVAPSPVPRVSSERDTGGRSTTSP